MKDQEGGSTWSAFHARINRSADALFYRLGYWVATHPKLTLFINLAFVAVCSLGFLNFQTETDGEVLWVPANSLSKRHETIILEYFSEGSEYAMILAESATEEKNVLTKETLDAVWTLDAKVKNLETEAGTTYMDMCTIDSDSGACKQPYRGITRFWGNSFDAYEASVTNDADVLDAINVSKYPDGQEVSLEAVFGNSMTFDGFRVVSSAKAFMQSYEVTLKPNDDDQYREIRQWELLFHALVEHVEGGLSDSASSMTVLNLKYQTGRSIDDALAESISGETFLFIVTYIIMIVVASVSLGRCGTGPVRRRSWLGLAGVLIVVTSGVAAYGLNSAFGVPFTSLSQILPFILIGIGVDDMFVLASSFDHTDDALPTEKRIALATERCGVSITYTSMTNFFAFMLGSATTLPAVRYFCLYAGVAILFDFFMQMTGFVAFLALDDNRQKAGRYDWFCCFKSSLYAKFENESVERGVILDETATPQSMVGEDHGRVEHHLTRLGTFLKEKYTPFILSIAGKSVVIFGVLALLLAGIYGVIEATQGFDVIDLAPDGHHAKEYAAIAREYDLEINTQYVPLHIYTQEVDYLNVIVQAEIQATDELMIDQTFVVPPVTSWLSSFLVWADSRSEYSANVGDSGKYRVYDDRSTFYIALNEFIEDADNGRFLADLYYNSNNEIEISRSGMYLIDLTSTENSVKALTDSRNVADKSTLDPKPMAFSPIFIISEQFLVIYDELIVNYTLALVAVALLSVLVLGEFKFVALVCITVVIIDIELLGFVFHWGLDVNSLTVIELIMAVGLVVDYMVHIVHYFLHQDPGIKKEARIAEALGEIGPSVLVGASTTFLGIMPMIFASNHVYRVFFKMFLIIISFGFFHGVVFVPVALSLLPGVTGVGAVHPTEMDAPPTTKETLCS